jgi:hypothetical protein
LVGKPEGKRLLGRPRCKWEDNIKMDLMEKVFESRAGQIFFGSRSQTSD